MPTTIKALMYCLDILQKLSPWDVDDGNYPRTKQDEADIEYAKRLAEDEILYFELTQKETAHGTPTVSPN
jgi:hypothetical protein